MRVAAYARVSTIGQETENPIAEIRRYVRSRPRARGGYLRGRFTLAEPLVCTPLGTLLSRDRR